MAKKNDKVSRTSATALIATTVIAILLLSLVPAMALPGHASATVIGTVTGYYNGEPIEGAKVTISYHGITRTDYTDSAGKYKFTNVPECFCLKEITASKEHFRPETKQVGVSGVTVVDFELWIEEQVPPMGTVTGTVTDYNNGEPIEGALVELTYHETVRSTYTDADGKYRFDEVDECRCYKSIKVTMKGYIPESKDVAVSGVTIVDFELWVEEQEPPSGTVTGTVTDYNNGEPIEGAQVDIEVNDHHRIEYTNENGLYRFENVPKDLGPATITVSMDGFRPEKTVTVVESVTVVDFQLWVEEQEPPKSVGVITGTVIDANDGTPIAGARMTLEYHDEAHKAVTDDEGRYSFSDVPICFCLKKISVAKDGYRPQSKEVGVDVLTIVDFSLQPSDGWPGPGDLVPIEGNGRESPQIAMGPAVAATGLTGALLALSMIALSLHYRRRGGTDGEE